MENILIIPILVGFFITLFFMPFWISKARKIGLVWENMNKYNFPKNLAGSGGLIVLLGFTTGVLSYIAIKTFVLNTGINIIEIFALLTTVLIAGMIGFTDDIFGWVHGGMSAKFRIFLLLFAVIPLMVINAGESTMMGVNLGLFYPLLFVPLGIIGATTTFNFLAGYNGLEAGQGIIILSALSLVTWKRGNSWLSLILLIMVFSLLAFYIFNKYPATVLPGDVLTYSVGALIAITAILGNIEKIAVFFFIPYILETGLKLRGRLKIPSFARVNEDGSLEVPHNKFYGLEHIAIYVLKKTKKNKKVYEREVVLAIFCFQVLIILLGFVLFRNSIF